MKCMQLTTMMRVFGVLAFACAGSVHADDWPQWMGPTRSGVYAEQGIVDRIPEEGLPVLWRAPVAHGYSGPAVADGRVFVSDYVIASGESTNNAGGRDKLTGTERLLCLDAKSGEQLWKHEYERAYNLSYPNGPRATPTVDGQHVYLLGAEGDLRCLKVSNGDLVWARQLREEYGTETPIWGYAAHPLVYQDTLITLAGGEGSAVVALNKSTGEEVWRALTTNDIGYCPPMVHQLGGTPQLIIWHSEAINALNPKTGEVTWSYPLQPRYGMSIAAPQFLGNRMFASGIGETAAMVELDEAGQPSDTLWQGRPKIGVYSGNATALFEAEAIFGSDCGTGQFIAVNPEDGSRYWATFELTTGGERRASHGTAFVVRHADKHILFSETGELIFAQLSAADFKELGRMQLLEPTGECFGREVVWSHPAFASRCVFARNDQEIVCVGLAK